MARAARSRSPRIDPIQLTGLTEGTGAELRAGDIREAERFQGAELGGRDLTGITFRECEFAAVSLDETKLRGATFAECIATEVHAPVLSAPRSAWRDVRLGHSRLGSVELYDATMQSVQIDGSKLDFVNLRNATLTDVLLSDCIIDELDLGSARVTRLELRNCRIGTLDVSGATLTDVDLRSSDFSAVHGVAGMRGCVIDDSQLSLMAPLFAAHLGIIVE